jgi:phospholipase C
MVSLKLFLPLADPVLVLASLPAPIFATVTVSCPGARAQGTWPVHYLAFATTSTCAAGVISMGIHVNNKLIYTNPATTLCTQISPAAGAEYAVVKQWDRCCGVTYTTINLTIMSRYSDIDRRNT